MTDLETLRIAYEVALAAYEAVEEVALAAYEAAEDARITLDNAMNAVTGAESELETTGDAEKERMAGE